MLILILVYDVVLFISLSQMVRKIIEVINNDFSTIA